jgi:hypothetical protein
MPVRLRTDLNDGGDANCFADVYRVTQQINEDHKIKVTLCNSGVDDWPRDRGVRDLVGALVT